MEMSISGIIKIFAIANGFVLAALLIAMLKPLFGFGTFELVVNDWRYAYGSGGWVIQHSKTYEVADRGYYPWYDWWFNKYGKSPPAS